MCGSVDRGFSEKIVLALQDLEVMLKQSFSLLVLKDAIFKFYNICVAFAETAVQFVESLKKVFYIGREGSRG